MPKGFKKIKPEKDDGMEVAKHFYYPHLSLNAEQLPEIKSWDVGKEYRIDLIVKQVSKEDRDDNPTEARFKVVAVRAGKAKGMTKKQQDAVDVMTSKPDGY